MILGMKINYERCVPIRYQNVTFYVYAGAFHHILYRQAHLYVQYPLLRVSPPNLIPTATIKIVEIGGRPGNRVFSQLE